MTDVNETMHYLRQATIERKTAETDISLTLDIDGSGRVAAATQAPFLNHMLDAFGRHGRFDIEVTASGDAAMDPHHTVEDVGIVLGQAFRQALADRGGIERFGHAYAPLDEALARCVVDCSGRPFLTYVADMPEQMINADFAASLVEEFWRAFAMNAAMTIHIDLLRSRNSHHAAEAIYKACGLAVREATRLTGRRDRIPSTKGVLA